MYTSRDEYFYFRPRSECSGNILPIRVDNAASDPSSVTRSLCYEDLVYFYELAITKIGLFRWAEDGFRSDSGIQGELTAAYPQRGLGFPFPDPEYGLDLGDMMEFPPYVPPRSVLLPDEPVLITSGLRRGPDPFGRSFGDRGFSDGPIGMLSLLRDLAVCNDYPPYSDYSSRRFAWDDVVFDFDPESEAYHSSTDITYGSSEEEEWWRAQISRSKMRPPFPAHSVLGTVTAALWASGPVENTEESLAEWFCDVFDVGTWIKERAEEAGLSLLEELRVLPYRQGLMKRAWLDLLYFDSVAVMLKPSSRHMTYFYYASYNSDGEFSWPEVRVSPVSDPEGFNRTFTLVGDFGYAPGEAEPTFTDGPVEESPGEGETTWSYRESWDASRTYVTCCAATSRKYSGGVFVYTGGVYTGMEAERRSVQLSTITPSGATRSSFELRLPSFPSDRLPFDPGLIYDIRGYLTCSWFGYSRRYALGAVDREQGAVDVPADPLTGNPSMTLKYDKSEHSGRVGSVKLVSWGCGRFSAPADVELDLGDDGACPVLRVSSSAISSALSEAESECGRSMPFSDEASAPSYDPLDLAPVPVSGYGRTYPKLVASFSGHRLNDPGAPDGSLAGVYAECYGSEPRWHIYSKLDPALVYVHDPTPERVVLIAGDRIECPGDNHFQTALVPDPSSGWTTGEEFGILSRVPEQGMQPCSGTIPYPGYNCVRQSRDATTANASSRVEAEVSVNSLWLFVRFRPKCAAEIALDALRAHIDSEDAG